MVIGDKVDHEEYEGHEYRACGCGSWWHSYEDEELEEVENPEPEVDVYEFEDPPLDFFGPEYDEEEVYDFQ